MRVPGGGSFSVGGRGARYPNKPGFGSEKGPQKPPEGGFDEEEVLKQLEEIEAAEREEQGNVKEIAKDGQVQASFRYYQNHPNHPYAEYRQTDLSRMKAVFEKEWGNHVIFETDDDQLRDGTLSALAKAVEPAKVLTVDLATISQYRDIENGIAHFTDTMLDTLKEQYGGSMPHRLYLALDGVDIKIQERLTNPK